MATKIATIGVNEDKPLSGVKKMFVKFCGRAVCRLGLLAQSYIWVQNLYPDIDYSEWLGPDWKKNQPKGRPPIMIGNHQSWSVLLSTAISLLGHLVDDDHR